MKNLFVVKSILENTDLSDEAFAVWCGLRNIMFKDKMEYFLSYQLIARSVFNRVPTRHELTAIKKGYTELVVRGFIIELERHSITECWCDISALYYTKDQGYISNITEEEMHQIMSIEGRHDKYKLLRYFAAQVGSFNQSAKMGKYKGKIGGMSMESFSEMIPIVKSTCISFNKILEDNQLLFIIRHRDFYAYDTQEGHEVKEISNTYSRWEDRELAQEFAEQTHGYKYKQEQARLKTEQANRNKALGQKLKHFYNGKQYDIETIKELYTYCQDYNTKYKMRTREQRKRGFRVDYKAKDLTMFEPYMEQIENTQETK